MDRILLYENSDIITHITIKKALVTQWIKHVISNHTIEGSNPSQSICG